jgi:excisionase family DNA binding protein
MRCIVRLTVKEAAQKAQVSQSLIYTWVKEKRLACFRMGSSGRRGRILIDPVDLEVVIRDCRQERHPLVAS